MLNLKKDFPIKTEIVYEIQNKVAQVRDILIEIDQLVAVYETQKDYFMTKEEVADYFRCSKNKIPKQIPRLRRGNESLFKKSDIEEYVKLKTKR